MNFLQEIRELLSKYSPVKLLLVLVLVLLPIFILLFMSLGSDTYKVLFSQLNEKEYSDVVRTLEGKNIDYQANEKNGSISVAENSVHDVRMLLMTEGVLSNTNIGFEIFDNSEFGMTEFSQKINYQRALQGELSRTISSLDEIKYARVHIVQPANKLFRSESDKSTASVTLFIKSGMSVTSAQINGIQNIVASSVDDLQKSDVVVSDQRGVVLSNNFEKDDNAHESKLSRKEQLEEYYKSKIEDVLKGSFGENYFVVSVNVELDYTKSVKTEEQYIADKENQALRRQRVSKNKNGKTVSSDTEYEIGKRIVNTEVEVGRLKRINIGVMVPKNTDKDTVKQLQEIIEMAGGIDKQRGDVVTVHASQLATATVEIKQGIDTEVDFTAPSSTTDTEMNSPKNILESEVTVSDSVHEKIQNIFGLDYALLIVIVVAGLIFSVILNVLMIFKRKTTKAKLSISERQQVLDEITNWFEQGRRENAG